MRYKLNIQGFADSTPDVGSVFESWKFNDTVDALELGVSSLSISFLCNGNTYSYFNTRKGFITYSISSTWNDDEIVYDTTAWTNSNYQIIRVSKSSSDYASFVTWAKANGGVLLEKGTYKWVDSPTNTYEGETMWQINKPLNFTSNSIDFTTIYISASKEKFNYINSSQNIKVYNYGSTWTNDAYKTITTTTDQYVDYDFYNYAITGGQLVKQVELPKLKAGTYVWADTLIFDGTVDIYTTLNFTSNNTNYDNLDVHSTKGGSMYYGIDTVYISDWVDTAYKIIVLSSEQEVSQEFYDWAITNGNLVYQEEKATLPAGAYKFNSTITGLSESDATQTLRFKLNLQGATYQGTAIAYGTSGISYTVIIGDESTTATLYADGAWEDDIYRIITITSDQEVTKSFYDWFMANAEIDHTIQAGTYNFVQHPETPDVFSQAFKFTSNKVDFTKMECKNTFGTLFSLFYDTGEVATSTNSVMTFKNSNYRVIEVEEAQEVDQTFYDWFTANTADSSQSIIIKKGKYLFNEELTEQTSALYFQNFKTIFSHINFTGLVLYNIGSNKSGYFFSDTNTTRINTNDGTWLNPQSRQFELTEDYNIAENNSSLSTKDALLIEDWFEANTTRGIDYHPLRVNGKLCNTWNGKAINKLNDKYIERKYSISGSFTNCTDQSYAKTNTIYSTDSIQLVLTANDGYELDYSKINVQNASVSFFDETDTSMLMAYIYNPLGNVSVSLSATPKTYTITTNLSNCGGNAENATTIQYGGGAILYFTANTGYELPDGVELTNVGSYNWNKETGKLVIAKPSGNVTIKIEAEQTMTQLATPQNVSVEDTTLSFDEVENAEEYEIFVDNVSIGSYQGAKTFTLPTALELGGGTQPVVAEGYNVMQGDIKVSSSVYQSLTDLNNGGTLQAFGNTCGLSFSLQMVKIFKMGVRLGIDESSDEGPEQTEDGKWKVTIKIPFLDKTYETADIHSLEFDYTNNTAIYTTIEAEDIDIENHTITFIAEKVDGSTLVLFYYNSSSAN